MTRLPRSLWACALAACSLPACATDAHTPGVRIVNQPMLMVSRATGTGVTELRLRNDLDKPVQVALTATTPSPLPIRIGFETRDKAEDPPGDPVFEQTLDAGKTVTILLVVSQDWTQTDTEIQLFNHYGAESLGAIPLRHNPKPMALDDSSRNLSLIDGRTSWIVVRNPDPARYRVHWELVHGGTVCEDDAQFEPYSEHVLQCTPKMGWNWWSTRALASAIKPDGALDGYHLVLMPRTGLGQLALEPLTSFEMKVRLDYFGAHKRAAIKYVFVLFLLTFGGLTSLLLSFYLPNKLSRSELREQLVSLAARTSDLSARISSRVAVIARLERSRLIDLLTTRSLFSPDFNDMAARCRDGIGRLKEKVDILEKMDTVLGLLDERQAEGAPPTKGEAILSRVHSAEVLLSKMETTDEDIARAKVEIDAACAAGETICKRDDDFAKQLQADAGVVLAEIARLQTIPAWSTIGPAAERAITDLQQLSQGAVPVPECYVALDFALQKCRLIVRYARLRDSMGPEAVTAQMQAHAEKLIERLHKQSWDALRCAKLALRELEEGIYPEDVIATVQCSVRDATGREVHVHVDPPWVYERASVEFGLRFNRADLDRCAAREEFKVEWDFDDEHEGDGWVACHYFIPRWEMLRRRRNRLLRRVRALKRMLRGDTEQPSPRADEPFHVKAVLYGPTGAVVRCDEKEPATLSLDVRVHRSELWRSSERWRAEAIKLSTALGIAVFGLASGAQGQIDKLDMVPAMVAIFLVGFSADSMKRLLTTQ